MEYVYRFSPRAYVKANMIKITLIYLLLVTFFITVLFINDTLSILSALVVILVFAAFLSFVVTKMISIRSGCDLKISNNSIEYSFVRFNGISSNLITERYEEDSYSIYKVDKYILSSSKITIYGVIKKEEKRVRNSYETSNVVDVKLVRMPMYFSDQKEIIQKLKEFQEANNG